MEPGEVYNADFPEAGPHPVIVVSRRISTGAITRWSWSARRLDSRSAVSFPSCVPFHAGQFGFTANCVAQCESILSIDLAVSVVSPEEIGRGFENRVAPSLPRERLPRSG